MPWCTILSVSIQFFPSDPDSIDYDISSTSRGMISEVTQSVWIFCASHSPVLQRWKTIFCRNLHTSGYCDTFSSEKTFKCNQCENDFRYEDCLKIHIGREHVRSGQTICLDVFSHFHNPPICSFRATVFCFVFKSCKFHFFKVVRNGEGRRWGGGIGQGDCWKVSLVLMLVLMLVVSMSWCTYDADQIMAMPAKW